MRFRSLEEGALSDIEIGELQEKLGVDISSITMHFLSIHRSLESQLSVFSEKFRQSDIGSVTGANSFGEIRRRMALLGDRVLALFLAEKVFYGIIESNHALDQLSSNEMLAEVAVDLELPRFILCLPNVWNGPQKDRVLADTLEAIIGAIYSEFGLQEAERFLTRVIGPKVMHIVGSKRSRQMTPISTLQHLVQINFSGTNPTYNERTYEGGYVVEVYAGEELLGRGADRRKSTARTKAVETAISEYPWGEDR